LRKKRESAKAAARSKSFERVLSLACLAAGALLIATAAASLVAPLRENAVPAAARLGGEALTAAAAVFLLTLYALHAFRSARPSLVAQGAGAAALARSGAASRAPSQARRPSPRGAARETGNELFSVADGERLPLGSPARAPGREAEPAADLDLEPATPGRWLERAMSLRARGRFEEAASVARAGLAADAEPGPLLLELSRAELALGRANAAIDVARDAHFAARSRESLVHLIRLLIQTRRFTAEDGAGLGRALRRRPNEPLLHYAAGIYESLHGDPRRAEKELQAALRLETDAGLRREIERDLARVEAAERAR
jgi:tetratricopeptide (TPR) repeat protein